MPIVGSVQATSLTAGSHTIQMPQANMTIVGVAFNGIWITIPIDPTRTGILANASGTTKTYPKWHNVTFVVQGTLLNYTTGTNATTIVTFYYGTAGEGQLPLTAFAGITTSVTLSGGAGTGTFTFPSGPLTLTGLTVADATGAAADVTVTFNTNTGQAINLYIPGGTIADVIVPVNLTVSQTVTFTVAGTGTDVVDAFAYYM